jgi:hypothetical protein
LLHTYGSAIVETVAVAHGVLAATFETPFITSFVPAAIFGALATHECQFV